MTITLHDVRRLIGLSIDGDGLDITAEPAELIQLGCQLTGRTPVEVTADFSASGLAVTHLRTRLQALIADPEAPPELTASVFLTILLGATLFIDKSGGKVKPFVLPLVMDHARTGSLAWGTWALAFLYRCLGQASRVRGKRICGFTALLQVTTSTY